jgi:lysophospholipase L1-like esterase
MTEPSVVTSRKAREAILVGLICLITVCGTIGGFLIGRSVTRDAFIQKVNGQKSANGITTLLEAGVAPLRLYPDTGMDIDDPLTAQALAKMYNVPAGNRDALIKRLRDVMWAPPYWPAPFVGQVARPFSSKNLHINSLGFRDTREHFENKDDRTIRIFFSGGSTAWGTGASSDDQTISALLEKKLNAEMSPRTGYKYEVVNAALPAWSTTQEKLSIQQRLVDLHPDAVLMFSGNNDVHWALHGSDVRWFFSYMDQNYITLLDEMYKTAGHPEWAIPILLSKDPIDCAKAAEIAERNVKEAAAALAGVNARLFFALQPNIVSTSKHLSEYESRFLRQQNKAYWDTCYGALRAALALLKAPNYRFLDLSRSFGNLGDDTELFLDQYHFVDTGNDLTAREIVEAIDWRAISPNGPNSIVRDRH